MAVSEVLLDVKVTALVALNGKGDEDFVLVLAGIGGNVEIYKWTKEASAKLKVFRAFSGASIHGFSVNHHHATVKKWVTNVLVYGGKSLAALEMDRESGSCEMIESAQCEDWIIHCQWQSRSEVYVLTAHNCVMILDLLSRGGLVRKKRFCPERCILYSGMLVNKEPAIVLSGTVFQEILVWPAQTEDNPIFHRLQGHEGVIFSIDFDSNLNHICSTSDDRSARLWHVRFSIENPHDWSRATVECCRVFRNHNSRIFRSSFLGQCLVTCGEDSNMIVWNENGELKFQKEIHGGSIWSVAASHNNLIFTGGGNASISCNTVWERPTVSEIDLSFLEKGDCPRIVRAYHGSILCLTKSGTLCSIGKSSSVKLFQVDDLLNYGLLEIVEDTCVIATLQGKILLFSLKEPMTSAQPVEKKLFDGKIFSLNILSPKKMLACGPNGKLKLVSISDFEITQFCWDLPKSGDQHWVSCAFHCDRRKLLIVGDRCGSCHLFDLSDNEKGPVQTVPAHSRYGIGGMRLFQDTQTLWTVGRDGQLKTHNLISGNDGYRLECVNSKRMNISWMEEIVEVNNQILILGFESTNFVIIDPEAQNVMFKLDCGGSHRSWHLDLLNLEKSEFNFAFIKDKRVYASKVEKGFLASSQLRPQFHSRQVNVMKHFRFRTSKLHCYRNYLVSAGEDGLIEFNEIVCNGKTTRVPVASLKSHISSVKCLDLCQENENEFFLVSGGGRAQLKIWVISRLSESSRIVVQEKRSFNLLGNDKRRKKTWRDHDVISDSEIRFTGVSVRADEDKKVIAAAGSDGKIRTFIWKDEKLQLICESESVACCLLFVQFRNNLHQIISTGTNGTIQVWEIEPSFSISLLSNSNIYDSGINAVYLHEDELGCGTDGGMVGIHDIEDDGKVWKARVIAKEMHAAQIVGFSKMSSSFWISCSIDQRLSIWKLKNEELCLHIQTFFDVGSPLAMATWEQDDHCLVAIGGEGLCVSKVDLHSCNS